MDFYRMSARIVITTAGVSQQNAAIHGMQSIAPYQTRNNVAQFGLHGFVSRPLPGAQMVVVHGGGDPSNSICVAVNDPRYHIAGLADGVVGVAHHLGASVLFFDDHIQVEGNGKPIILNNTGDITITTAGGSGNVTVVGNILATGEITAQSTGAAIKLSAHEHTNGNNGADTGGPIG